MQLQPIELRRFQVDTAEKAKTQKSILVHAPTGMGKTFALLLAIEPHLGQGLCIILSPLITLCQQHVETAKWWFEQKGIEVRVGSCFGGKDPVKRAQIWKSCDIVVATAESLINDIESEIIDLSTVRLIGFDEAQKASGNSAYNQLGRILKLHPHIQLIGLTGTVRNVSEIEYYLGLNSRISHIPHPIEKDNMAIYAMKVGLGKEIEDLLDNIDQTKEQLFATLQLNKLGLKFDYLKCGSSKYVSAEIVKYKQQREDTKQSKSPDQVKIARYIDIIARLFAFRFLIYLESLLVCESIVAAHEAIVDKHKTNYYRLIAKFEPTCNLTLDVESLADNKDGMGKNWHPKDKLTINSLLWAKSNNHPALVFCNHKSTARGLAKYCKEHGIAGEVINSDMSLPQREVVIDDFNDGKLDAIIATSAMELGADLKTLDVVVLRSVPNCREAFNQQIGRCGRREGELGVVHAILADHPYEARRYNTVSRGHGVKTSWSAKLPDPNEPVVPVVLTNSQRAYRRRARSKSQAQQDQILLGL